MTVATTGRSALAQSRSSRVSGFPYAIWLLVPGMLVGMVVPAKTGRARLLGCALICIVLTGCMFQAACGGGNASGGTEGSGGTTPGTYSITVTGTASANQQNTNVTVTVQQ